jgi:hypothetical protein
MVESLFRRTATKTGKTIAECKKIWQEAKKTVYKQKLRKGSNRAIDLIFKEFHKNANK